MKVAVQKIIGVTLEMNEKEARWLKAYMSNYLGPVGTVEGGESMAMREDLFCTLREGLEK